MKNPFWVLAAVISFAVVCVFTNMMHNGESVRRREAGKAENAVVLSAEERLWRPGAFLSLEKTLSSTKKTILVAASWVARLQSAALPKKGKPAAASRPRLALVIDDFGYNYGMAERIAQLRLRATWAIIPGTPHGHKIAEYAVRQGQPFLLHVPMQAMGDPDGGRNYVIGIDVPEKKMAEYLASLQKDFPHAIGINNHRGSKATSDAPTMRRFMKALSATRWGFLDSRTSGRTVAEKTARNYHIPTAQNKVFIDGTTDLPTMKARFNAALHLARKYGNAVAICHAREKTLPFLAYLSTLDLNPVELVTVDEIWNSQQPVKEEKQ